MLFLTLGTALTFLLVNVQIVVSFIKLAVKIQHTFSE